MIIVPVKAASSTLMDLNHDLTRSAGPRTVTIGQLLPSAAELRGHYPQTTSPTGGNREFDNVLRKALDSGLTH